MRLFAAIFSTLLLATTGTLAQGGLTLPNGYNFVEIHPVSPENQYHEAKGNPHVPLFNATLGCGKMEVLPMYTVYGLMGFGWDGVTEQMLKQAAKQGGLMKEWKFESWGDKECIMQPNGTEVCTKTIPGWRATFDKALLVGTEKKVLSAFERLTGIYGKNHERTEFVISDGTHNISSEEMEGYPKQGKYFYCDED